MKRAEITSLKPLQIETEFGETYEDLDFFEHYGFTSSPPLGTKVLVEDCLVFAAQNEQDLKPGEAVFYAGKKTKIKLSPDGKIKIQAGEVELLDLLSQMLKELSTLQTNTGTISPSSATNFLALKAKLDGIIGS